MIDADPKDLMTIKEIFKTYLPNAKILVFGSRVDGGAKTYSDLDIAVKLEKETVARSILSKIKEAFQDSKLPFRVDVIDYNKVSENSQKIINQKYTTL